MKHTVKTKGNITLTTVLFVSVILLLGGITLVISSVDFNHASRSFYSGTLAQIRARGCLNDGLLRIKNNTSYIGSFSINFADGSCTGNIQNDTAPNIKNVTITGQVKKVDTSVIPFTVSN